MTVGTPYDTDVTVSAVAWNGDVANAGHATFNEALTVDVTLTAQNGFTFEGLDANSFAANGYVVTSVEKVGRDNLTVIVHMNAPAVAEAKITALTVDLTAPSNGDPLATNTTVSALTPANSTVTDPKPTVAWEGATTEGEATTGDELTVTITVTAADGYVFDAGVTVTFDADDDDTADNLQVSQDGKTLTITGTITVA